VAHLRKSDRLRRRKRMERTAGPRSCIHLAAMVAATFAVVGMGSGLVSGSMTAASAAVVRSSDLSPHGASVPNTPDSVVAISPTPDDKGYLTITANGFVSAYGDGVFAGGQAGGPAPVVGIQTGEDTGGFWTVRADGGVFTIGDVPFYGSMGGKTLNAPVVGMALTPDREGYWLVAADGGVFSFGNAHFYGSTGALHLNAPIVGLAPTPDGGGYWLVAADGGVFSFGDAAFYGSMAGTKLNAPVVGIAASVLGGYWLVAADGGVFSFGNAPFYGSMAGTRLNGPVVGIAATSNGMGYWLVGTDDGVFTFGDAPFFGPTSTSTTTTTTTTPSSSVAFVQADDTGTINGNTTSIASGQSNQVLAHDTGIGHSVVLMIQTLSSTETDTVTSVSSGMGTFQFVNSYNDGADYEIWVCTDTTGAADTVTVTTPTNAWNAFAVEFNAPATGFVNGGGQVVDPSYLGDQSWTVSPGAAGNIAVIGVDTLDAYTTGPAAPWTYYNSGYWSFSNGTSAAWQVAPSSSPLTATWVTDGGESSSQGVVLEY